MILYKIIEIFAAPKLTMAELMMYFSIYWEIFGGTKPNPCHSI